MHASSSPELDLENCQSRYVYWTPGKTRADLSAGQTTRRRTPTLTDAGPKGRPALNLLRLLSYRSTVAVIPLVPLKHVLTISRPPPLSWNLVQGGTGLKDNSSRRVASLPHLDWFQSLCAHLTLAAQVCCLHSASTQHVFFSARVDRSAVAFSPPATCAGQGS